MIKGSALDDVKVARAEDFVILHVIPRTCKVVKRSAQAPFSGWSWSVAWSSLAPSLLSVLVRLCVGHLWGQTTSTAGVEEVRVKLLFLPEP